MELKYVYISGKEGLAAIHRKSVQVIECTRAEETAWTLKGGIPGDDGWYKAISWAVVDGVLYERSDGHKLVPSPDMEVMEKFY